MNGRRLIANTSTAAFDAAIEILLVSLLAFMPFACGARNQRSQAVVIAISGAIVICFSLRQIFDGRRRMVWIRAYVPALLFAALTTLQLVPLPAALIGAISPNTARLRAELLGGLPGAENALRSMPLSFYPEAGVQDIRIALSAAGVFIVVLNVFGSDRQIKRLLMAIAIIGAAVALLTLAQDIFGNGRIYWLLPNPAAAALSGPFVNHSHYAQFMSLSIGAAIGWICVRLREDFTGRPAEPVAVFNYICLPSTRIVWAIVAAAGIGAATVFVSLSRGGMISVLVSACVTTLILCCRRNLRAGGWVMVITAIAAFACILATGFDAVYERFATLSVADRYGSRIQILKDLQGLFRLFPVFGAGMGAHLAVYPMFQSINTTAMFTHAENEYAQLTEETGLAGLLIMIMFGTIVVSAYVKNIRRGGFAVCSAAYGLGFGLLAILIHSLSDFGQHVPANAFLSVVFCALLLSLARYKGRQGEDVPAAAARRWPRIIAFVCVCAVFVWAAVDAADAGIAEARWNKVLQLEKPLAGKDWQGTKAGYAELISNASAAAERRPGNVFYRYCLNVYRWYSITRTDGPDADVDAAVRNSTETVRDIADRFNRACFVCPTYGPLYSMAGQIEKFILNENAGAEKIRKGYMLAPHDPAVCFTAGRLDAAEGNIAAAVEKFNRAAALDGRLFAEAVDIYINQLSRPLLAVDAAGDDVCRLIHTAEVLAAMHYDDIEAQVRSKVKDILRRQCSQADASPLSLALLADICARDGDAVSAMDFYRRAIAADYSQVSWRMKLARLLADSRQPSEAMKQAQMCLRLAPGSAAARNLVRELSVRHEILNAGH